MSENNSGLLRISARKLLTQSTERLWGMLTGDFVLVFDDGEIVTNYRRTLYSSHVWDFHRQFTQEKLRAITANVPEHEAPLNVTHHMDYVLNEQRLRSDTHIKLLGQVAFDIYDWASAQMSEEEKIVLRSELRRKTFEVRDNIYGDFSYRAEEYVGSIDFLDYLQVFDHPTTQKAYSEAPKNDEGVSMVNNAVDSALKDLAPKGNQLAKSYVSGFVRKDQLLQCIGWRGAVTDMNGNIFGKLIDRGYFEGIYKLADSMQESRSASKSLELSKATLRNTEYFARRLQLVSMSVENLHYGDCGSGRYIRWRVRGPEKVENHLVYPGDLPNLIGKMYLDPQTNTLKPIRRSDTHLINQVIQIRSVINCCHPDPAGICSTCLGELSLSVPEYSNIGHLASTYMTEQSTQGVLSTKHLDSNALLEAIVLDEYERQFLKVHPGKNSFLLSDQLKNKKVKLIVSSNQAKNLADVLEVEDVSQLSLPRVSEISEVLFQVDDGHVIRSETVNVYDNKVKRAAYLTYEMLAHAKEKGWEFTESGHYVIDLADWNHGKPILELPAKQFSMGDHSKRISEILESSVVELIARDRIASPEGVLTDLFTHVNSRLSVNLAMLEIPFYASMIISAEDRNYGLPKPWTKRGLGVMRKIMDYRSEGARMAYERHASVILNPESFALENRPDSPFDMAFMPREVMEHNPNIR